MSTPAYIRTTTFTTQQPPLQSRHSFGPRKVTVQTQIGTKNADDASSAGTITIGASSVKLSCTSTAMYNAHLDHKTWQRQEHRAP
mmetsp:Transcript_37240/g.61160  ORF Transcript_37240/g.61160 Transcript_37240/m.61160 type:complete len:85 (-) Transcript_37240:478-732(-)